MFHRLGSGMLNQVRRRCLPINIRSRPEPVQAFFFAHTALFLRKFCAKVSTESAVSRVSSKGFIWIAFARVSEQQ